MLTYTEEKIASWNRLGMRKSFGLIMLELAKQDPNIIILVADVMSSAGLNDFKKELPNQIFNIGIAEQNMVAIAAGFAKEGKNVFVLSFAPFVSLRAYEAIRTLIGGMGLNVKVIALASGMSLGTQGMTHFCLEDIALMRLIPNMMLVSPADCVEMAASLEYLALYKGPAYLRLTGIDGSLPIFKEKVVFNNENLIKLRDGSDIVLLPTGSVTSDCIRASRALEKKGISCSVYNISCLKPFPRKLLDSLSEYKMIVTIEEHFLSGGLGSIIAEYITIKANSPILLRIGVSDNYPIGDSYNKLLEKNGLTAQSIRDKIFDYYMNFINKGGQ